MRARTLLRLVLAGLTLLQPCVAAPSKLIGRAGSCVAPTSDTPTNFLDDATLADYADNAPTPYGYDRVFADKQASLQAANYMGMFILGAYDTFACQQHCDEAVGCVAFNIYAERDPSQNPTSQCPNPSSVTNIVCALWGSSVTESQATNSGQYRDDFHVVITASNAYNKVNPPAIPDWVGPTEFGCAIEAPLSAQGYYTYMGYESFPYDDTVTHCADACTARTGCKFFNSYVLSLNGQPQNLYCSFYNQTWGREYSDNCGYYSGNNVYTVSDSYGYSQL